jgi:Leucine-rich repeat (LRR) protein
MRKGIKRFFWVMGMGLVLCAGISTAFADISPGERQSLIALYQQTDGDRWQINAGWKEPPFAPDGFAMPGTENRWYGVTCDQANTRVTALRLPRQGLAGEDLSFLSGLVYLQTLDISDNNLSGHNFAFLSALADLRNLYLRGNLFESPILPMVSQLGQLRELDLSHNRFSDENLASLAALINLEVLDLSHNRLYYGDLAFIQILPQLTHLDLSDNLLSGPFAIPWNQLKYVDLSDNDLEWRQFTFAGSDNLEHLDFSHNRMVFYVWGPPGNGPLRYLDLSHTQVPTFPDISGFQQLEYVDLSYCNLSDQNGPVPFLNALSALKHLDISHNRLGQYSDALFMVSGLTALEYWDLSHNRLAFQQPVSIPDAVDLKHVDLSHNKITGPIDFTSNTNLEFIDVSHNALTQEPMQQNLSALQYYDVSHNNLQLGYLDRFSSATALEHLDASHNKLGGQGFDSLYWLTGAPDLNYLDLSDNQFRFDNLDMLGSHAGLEVLNLSNNHITGQMPFFNSLSPLQELNLAGNRISGPVHLPDYAAIVNLGCNHFDISTLQMFPATPELKELYLNGNAMVGRVPPEIVYLDGLDHLELGYNGLFTDDPGVVAFLETHDPQWDATQTVAPENIAAVQTAPDAVSILWDPIAYDDGVGGYAVSYSHTEAGPFTPCGTTSDKTVSEMSISGLDPGTEYFFRVRTVTAPQVQSPNTLTSEPGQVWLLLQ